MQYIFFKEMVLIIDIVSASNVKIWYRRNTKLGSFSVCLCPTVSFSVCLCMCPRRCCTTNCTSILCAIPLFLYLTLSPPHQHTNTLHPALCDRSPRGQYHVTWSHEVLIAVPQRIYILDWVQLFEGLVDTTRQRNNGWCTLEEKHSNQLWQKEQTKKKDSSLLSKKCVLRSNDFATKDWRLWTLGKCLKKCKKLERYFLFFFELIAKKNYTCDDF